MNITQDWVVLWKLLFKDTVTAAGAQGWDAEAPRWYRGHALSALSLEAHSAKADSAATFGKQFPKWPL